MSEYGNELHDRVENVRDTFIYRVVCRPADPEKPIVKYPYATRHDAVGAAIKVRESHELLLGPIKTEIAATYVESGTVVTGPFAPTKPPCMREEVPTVTNPDQVRGGPIHAAETTTDHDHTNHTNE